MSSSSSPSTKSSQSSSSSSSSTIDSSSSPAVVSTSTGVSTSIVNPSTSSQSPSSSSPSGGPATNLSGGGGGGGGGVPPSTPASFGSSSAATVSSSSSKASASVKLDIGDSKEEKAQKKSNASRTNQEKLRENALKFEPLNTVTHQNHLANRINTALDALRGEMASLYRKSLQETSDAAERKANEDFITEKQRQIKINYQGLLGFYNLKDTSIKRDIPEAKTRSALDENFRLLAFDIAAMEKRGHKQPENQFVHFAKIEPEIIKLKDNQSVSESIVEEVNKELNTPVSDSLGAQVKTLGQTTFAATRHIDRTHYNKSKDNDGNLYFDYIDAEGKATTEVHYTKAQMAILRSEDARQKYGWFGFRSDFPSDVCIAVAIRIVETIRATGGDGMFSIPEGNKNLVEAMCRYAYAKGYSYVDMSNQGISDPTEAENTHFQTLLKERHWLSHLRSEARSQAAFTHGMDTLKDLPDDGPTRQFTPWPIPSSSSSSSNASSSSANKKQNQTVRGGGERKRSNSHPPSSTAATTPHSSSSSSSSSLSSSNSSSFSPNSRPANSSKVRGVTGSEEEKGPLLGERKTSSSADDDDGNSPISSPRPGSNNLPS